MSRPPVEVLTDDQITPRILDILRNAKKHATLVSPYNKFWTHLRNELKRASERGVRVHFVHRDGEQNGDIEWLEHLGVKVYAVENLHAKIYLNESSVLITSMNLHESSSKNSMEICISTNDPEIQQEVRGYIASLMDIAQAAQDEKKTAPRPTKTRRSQTVSETRTKYQADETKPSLGGLLKGLVAVVTNEGGRCIRCAISIPLNGDRPLCEDCFKSWNRYENWDYEEDYCHKCGADWDTSYAKPLCRPCYNQV